ITRMINKCTYLVNKCALPLQSIIYQEYILLNELNTIRVNNKKLSTEAKLDALEQLFKKNNTVTITKFKNWLQIYFGENKAYSVTGLSDEKKFNGSMSSWNQFTNIGFDLTNKDHLKMAEDIILWATIFSEKETLKKKIERTYPQLTKQQVKSILSLTFKGWGRLSYQLLDGIYFTLSNGDKTTILERMRNTNFNFMQIINDKENGIATKLEELMADNISELDILSQIQELPGSPAIKKGIQQAVLLVEEIKKIMKKEPKKIFIEFAREDREKKGTRSRYKRLEEVYKVLLKENDRMYREDVYQELKNLKQNEEKLNNQKIFLYFLQNGRCLYSGKEIDLNTSDLEIDHIIPRSYTKDNSLDNLALVLKKENQRKKDDLLLSEKIIQKNKKWWNYLKRKQLMTEKKYLNLTREKITLNAQKGFINRQLVETRQISKHVKNLLTNLYPETKIQTLKAQFNSDYRNSNKLYKIRSLNDYHHAHDAYLSIFLGEFIDRKLPWINNYDPKYRHFYDKQIKSIYSDKKFLNRDNKYGLLELIYQSNEKVNWEADVQNKKVKKYLNYKDCFITYKVEEKSGEFYDQNLSPAGKDKMTEQKRGRDPEIYGGYKSQYPAYLTLIRFKNRVRAIPIPVQINQLIKDNQLTLQDYIKSLDSSYEIIRECILINTLFELNNHPFILRSSSERINGKQLIISNNLHQLLYYVERGLTYDQKQEDFKKYLKVLIDKLTTQYTELSGSERLAKLIEEHLEELYVLSDEEINTFVNESLKFFQVNSENPNFKGIPIDAFKKLTSRYGRMNSINWSQDITIIDQSITGYYESRLKL
ncbi:MAG TPA: type II CRISPR RNA-guided endonuclease Cas9, partial [Chitinophagaceae bacterium]|nr:type II CRISPR RNA-guided endonuclease Cas9 [Chitinophagaceae bacterium]